MYLETIESEGNPSYSNYECDFCKEKIFGGDPHCSNDINSIHICEKCTFNSAETFIEANIGGWKIFWLEEMKNKYFSRKVRSCYLPKKLRDSILKKYKFTCQHCGLKEKLTIDHIKPVSRGGTNKSSNLQVLCKSCNSKKSNKYD